MKSVDESKIEVQAFVCTNEKAPGKPCCLPVGGHEFFTKLKTRIKDDGLWLTHKVRRSGCLDHCNTKGCTVVVYRKGESPQWFAEVTDEDFDRIRQVIVEK